MTSLSKTPRGPLPLPADAAIWAILLANLPGIGGCASPGLPRPPSLRLPAVVTDLTADRIGDQIRLRWTTPAQTTDKLPITAPITAQICRAAVPGGPTTGPVCTPVLRLPVESGPSEATDTLPAPLTAAPPMLLQYTVELLNPAGRSAGSSCVALAAAGPAPSPIHGLQARPTERGALLQWNSDPLPHTYVALVRSSAGQPAAPAPAAKTPALPFLKKPPATASDVELRTDPAATDPGGTLDPSAQTEATYAYIAQRVQPVDLLGHHLELRSLPSAPVEIVMRDTFPPGPPSGLAAIPAEAAGAAAALSIYLSWEPNTEPDLAGYIVYREESPGPPQRLNPAPLPAPSFSDRTALPGHHYIYRVSAVDASGNESPRSAPTGISTTP